MALAFPRLAGAQLVLALTMLLAAFAPTGAAAQQEPEFFDTPYAPGQWNIGRRVDESELRYCVDPRDPSWEVDGAIADAIAGALLLEPKRYVVESQIVIEDITKVYEVMLKHCDVHMGFKLIPEGYSDWMTLTRAYYEAQYVFVTADPALKALADLAPSRAIGATIGTSAHLRLVSYLTALPAAQRWPTYPYGTNELALASLVKGEVAVALVWGPDFWAKQKTDPAYANLHVIAPDPLPPTALGVGALLLKQNTFLRTSIDDAITALSADGTIQSILDRYGFPATAKP
jgi:polar amino acid transport system substrate-binding protein